jgi:hypothetical protein
MLEEAREAGAIEAKWKNFCARKTWKLTKPKVALFKAVKGYLASTKFLVYFNPACVLYLKIDGSIERGFGVIVFHLEKDYKVPIDLAKITLIVVKPIMFLSKSLGSAEKNYYPMELEVVYLV